MSGWQAWRTGRWGADETTRAVTTAASEAQRRLIHLDPAFGRPGPAVLAALAEAAPSPRSPEFRKLLFDLRKRTQGLFHTRLPTLLLLANGSGTMEAAIRNLIPAGAPVLAVSNGHFGDRWVEMLTAYGADVSRLHVPWGLPVTPRDIDAALVELPNPWAVILTHVESSTGVVADVGALTEAVRRHSSDTLVFVDAVASFPGHDVRMDEWDVDVVVAASHKALACPAGIGLVALSERAWLVTDAVTTPRYCFDFRAVREAHNGGQTRFSAPVHLVHALAASLDLVEAEGLNEFQERHRRQARLARARLAAIGLPAIAPEPCAASTVSVTELPVGVSAPALVARLQTECGVELAPGRGLWEEHTVRIGHMGHVTDDDITKGIEALAHCLAITICDGRGRAGESPRTWQGGPK